jgi:hypothetical protein
MAIFMAARIGRKKSCCQANAEYGTVEILPDLVNIGAPLRTLPGSGENGKKWGHTAYLDLWVAALAAT